MDSLGSRGSRGSVGSIGAVLLLSAACATTSGTRAAERVPARAEHAIDVMLEGFDRQAAMGHIHFMSQFWRLAGNDAFDQSIGRIEERLLSAGFAIDRRGTGGADGPPASPARVHSYPNSGHGWDHSVGTLAILNADGTETVVLSRESQRL